MIHYKWWQLTPNPTNGQDSGPSFNQSVLTALRSIVINTGNFLPSLHSPAMGSGRHHLAVTSPPAAGRIIEYVNLLPQAQREKTGSIISINCANAWPKGATNPIEPEKSFDRLVFEGYGRADRVTVDGLKMSQNATVKID